MSDENLKTTNNEIQNEEEYFMASQWKLMYWKFREHKLAVFSFILILTLYVIGLFAPFFAPYDIYERNLAVRYAPPQKIHFIDEEGRFHFRPFVYELDVEVDMKTLQRIYSENREKKYPIYFFVRGSEYKLWGLFNTDLHLFGTKKGYIYLLGTEQLGRDVLSRIIFGMRISLSVGLIGVLLSVILGIVLGGISGYFGGVIDNIIQRLSEILRSFPSIPLWMALSAALPQDWPPLFVYFGITIILSLRGWTGLGRQVRGKVLSLKNDDFVLAARFCGANTSRIILVHLIPSFLSHIIATLTLSIPGMILGETALSFLGIGLRPPIVSWGVLLKQAQNVHTISMAPWLLLPGLFVIISILAFNFFGDGLRDAADPYSV